MHRYFMRSTLLALGIASLAPLTIHAASMIPAALVNFDLTGLPGTATIDISNQTGPNSTPAPDPTFPVTTSVSLTNLSLTLFFSGGSTQTFGSSYFTLAPDGLSLDGNAVSISTPVTKITLTGNFSPTGWALNDGISVTVGSSFSASITNSSGTLIDGDFAVISGSTGITPTVPEPSTWLLLVAGFAGLLLWRFRLPRKGMMVLGLLIVAALAAAPAANAAVKLNVWTTPTSGIAGTSLIWVTGSGFPSGTIAPSGITLDMRTSCASSTGQTAASVLQVVPIIGTSEKMQFKVPSSVATGNYFVTISGKTTGGTTFSSGNCSEISVTNSSPTLGSCNPGSSMGMLVPKKGTGTAIVTAFVPNANWGGGGVNVQAVPIEGGSSPVTITTAKTVNSCSTDSVSGVTACTANGFPADVYLISGNHVTKTVTTGANTILSFSGGSCYNCGIAVNAVTHQAAITIGLSGSSGGMQFINLANGAIGTPVPLTKQVSEDILWDPFLNLILSPAESSGGNYDLLKISSGSALPGPSTVKEFTNATQPSFAEYDSAGEDCTTGIALTTWEGTGNLYLADLTRASFTSGSPGTWTAPNQTQSFPEFLGLAAGTSAVAIAPGSTHLGVVAGEFGGNTVGVIQLPATSGSGTPGVVDYAYATLPPTPDGFGFSNGFDPHTTTAYTSPNNGKAYAVLASWATGSPSYLGIVDIKAMLSAPRNAGTHTVDPTYDLLAHGVVRYVITH
jgi:hypothetical protein